MSNWADELMNWMKSTNKKLLELDERITKLEKEASKKEDGGVG